MFIAAATVAVSGRDFHAGAPGNRHSQIAAETGETQRHLCKVFLSRRAARIVVLNIGLSNLLNQAGALRGYLLYLQPRPSRVAHLNWTAVVMDTKSIHVVLAISCGSRTCKWNSPGCVAQATYFEINRGELSMMSTSVVLAGFASHGRNNFPLLSAPGSLPHQPGLPAAKSYRGCVRSPRLIGEDLLHLRSVFSLRGGRQLCLRFCASRRQASPAAGCAERPDRGRFAA
jgi:hypothetical protein